MKNFCFTLILMLGVGIFSKVIGQNRQYTFSDVIATICNDYITSLENQKSSLRLIKANPKIDAQTRNKAAAAISKVSSGIMEMKRISSQNAKATLDAKKFKSVLAQVDRKGLGIMREADNVIVIVINNPVGGGDGGGDEDPGSPDCSGAYENIFSACNRAVSIRQACGYYTENGGAPAVDAANDKCMMDARTAQNACEQGSTSDTGPQERAYETSALQACAEYESSKQISNNPPQTTTTNGN